MGKKRTNLTNLGQQFLTVNCKAKAPNPARKYCTLLFSHGGYELAILKLLYVYTVIEQIRKYIMDNENQVSSCQRKNIFVLLQIIKGGKPRMNFMVLD